MQQYLSIPHRSAPGMCPVNGLRDLIQWRYGSDWSNEFVWGLGQGAGFAYLRFNKADPPRQVYFGSATGRQHAYLAGLFDAGFTAIENRAFKFSWAKACAALDEKMPPILGPLDMYHLHFYTGIYLKRHIPIHYEMLVGYDDKNAYVQDTGMENIQALPLNELRLAWDVNVTGLGKRNRLAVFAFPVEIAPVEALVKQAVADQCQTMLHPPVSLLGIPAMKKAAREIAAWPEDLGEEVAARCLRQVRSYLSSPPDSEGNHFTAGRDRYIQFLQDAGQMTGYDFTAAIGRFRESIQTIADLAEAIRRNDLEQAAAGFRRLAEIETAAFSELGKAVGIPEMKAY